MILKSRPSGALVIIDGIEKRKTNLKLVKIDPDVEHIVEIIPEAGKKKVLNVLPKDFISKGGMPVYEYMRNFLEEDEDEEAPKDDVDNVAMVDGGTKAALPKKGEPKKATPKKVEEDGEMAESVVESSVSTKEISNRNEVTGSNTPPTHPPTHPPSKQKPFSSTGKGLFCFRTSSPGNSLSSRLNHMSTRSGQCIFDHLFSSVLVVPVLLHFF
ncbi:MAG: hypothetical protein GY822_30490 [Deltaproteobacteria bacterium]|nr:hypothetical protein [Deltaproteobacteria bacterium]